MSPDRKRQRLLFLGLAVLTVGGCARRPPSEPRELRIAIEETLESLDPATDSLNAWAVLGNVFEPLVAQGADLRIEPALAVGWATPEETLWSFELRPGVTFHDGTPLSPARVVAGIERVRNDLGSSARSWLASVASIEAASPFHVLVRTRGPDPLLLYHLAQVPIALGKDPREVTAHPVGTGPYRVAGRADGGLSVEAFPGWWGPAPKVRRARFVPLPESAGVAEALTRGRIDLAKVPLVAGGPASFPFPTEEVRGLSTMFLWIKNLGRAAENPLADVRVRRALTLALDRRAIAARATGRPDSAARQLVPAAMFGYQPELVPEATDIAAARLLLASAGYAGGVTLDLAFRETPLARLTAEAVAADLEKAGVRAHLRAVSYEESLRPTREIIRGLFVGFWAFDVPDASSFLSDCVRTRDLGLSRGLMNQGFSSPRMDDLIDRAAALNDAASRLDMVRNAFLLANEEVPVVPLFEVVRIWGHARDIAYRPRADERIVLTEIAYRATSAFRAPAGTGGGDSGGRARPSPPPSGSRPR